MSSRRDFFRRLTGMGALMATSQLPSWAEDNPALFPQRGGFERLGMNYVAINIGLETPFSLLHISDTHRPQQDFWRQAGGGVEGFARMGEAKR